MQFTPRDLEILELVARHRFLRSSHIVDLAKGSRQQVLRRLQVLYHHGYLERPKAQLDYYHEGGSRPMVYGLGSRGAGRLRHDLDMPFHTMGWSAKNKGVGRVFLKHALIISDFMVLIEQACRNTPGVRLLSSADLPPRPDRKHHREPFGWLVNLDASHRLGVIPDRVFGLAYTTEGGNEQQAWYFLEADRATMPVTRQGLDQSSVFRKLLAYERSWSQNLHRSKLGFERFRVLMVTSSTSRADHIRQACTRLKQGRGLFLFADVSSLTDVPDLLAHPWRSVRGMDTMLPQPAFKAGSGGVIQSRT